MEIRDGWATVGTLVDGGSIVDALPRLGLDATQAERLLIAAVQVCLFGRICLDGWAFRLGIGWIVDVTLR